MEAKTIKELVKLRLVVYNLGVEHNLWKSLEVNGAKEMLDYIFPKTGKIAFYNLVVETVKTAHKDYVPVGEYSLFKLPTQYEEEILSYLKANPDDESFAPEDNSIQYLETLSTITCSPSLEPVFIGAIKDSGIETILKIAAFHYLSIFNDNTNSYPYFE